MNLRRGACLLGARSSACGQWTPWGWIAPACGGDSERGSGRGKRGWGTVRGTSAGRAGRVSGGGGASARRGRGASGGGGAALWVQTPPVLAGPLCQTCQALHVTFLWFLGHGCKAVALVGEHSLYAWGSSTLHAMPPPHVHS